MPARKSTTVDEAAEKSATELEDNREVAKPSDEAPEKKSTVSAETDGYEPIKERLGDLKAGHGVETDSTTDPVVTRGAAGLTADAWR